MLQSPVTGSNNVIELSQLDTKELAAKYRNQYGLDVTRFFNNVDYIKKCRCKDTGYEFFLPFSIAGDGNFYKELQSFDWYYDPWKWEHRVAYEMCAKTDKILEVGSGGNAFVEKLHYEGFDITGLELNPASVESAKGKGLRVYGQFVQDHAKENLSVYDKVFSFQVLEHITEIKSFIEAQIDTLKPGGKLLICVPNNDSFIQYSNDNPLNLPPHHMGHWNTNSLKSLVDFFPLQLVEIKFEPLQKYHYQWYQSIMEDQKIKNRFLRSLFRRSPLKKMYAARIEKNAANIIGHSILAVYSKI